MPTQAELEAAGRTLPTRLQVLAQLNRRPARSAPSPQGVPLKDVVAALGGACIVMSGAGLAADVATSVRLPAPCLGRVPKLKHAGAEAVAEYLQLDLLD